MHFVPSVLVLFVLCLSSATAPLAAQASVFARGCAGSAYHCYTCHDFYWPLPIRVSGAFTPGGTFFVDTDDYTDATPTPSLLPAPCNAQLWPRGGFSCYAPGEVLYVLAVSPSTQSVFVPVSLTGGPSMTCHSLVPLDIVFLHVPQWSANPISQRVDVPISPSFTGLALHFQYWLVAARPVAGTRVVGSDGLRVVLQ